MTCAAPYLGKWLRLKEKVMSGRLEFDCKWLELFLYASICFKQNCILCFTYFTIYLNLHKRCLGPSDNGRETSRNRIWSFFLPSLKAVKYGCSTMMDQNCSFSEAFNQFHSQIALAKQAGSYYPYVPFCFVLLCSVTVAPTFHYNHHSFLVDKHNSVRHGAVHATKTVEKDSPVPKIFAKL